jgi:DNA-binding transcriptional MerR regulator
MSQEIPHKLYFKIGEVSKLACVAPHVLRYWESEFKEIHPKRANSNQRLYRRTDVELILLLKSLLHDQGYTLIGAKKYLQTMNTPEASVPNKVLRRDCLGAIKAELLEVKKMLSEKDT